MVADVATMDAGTFFKDKIHMFYLENTKGCSRVCYCGGNEAILTVRTITLNEHPYICAETNSTTIFLLEVKFGQ